MFQNQFYRLKFKKNIPLVLQEKLTSLGKEALLHRDVPVGALVLYNDTIIGTGFNTVNRDSNISSHAEINALNEAINKYGHQFHQLDRDKLVLYSTFEPCEMCKGAILNQNIKHVYFEQNKPITSQMKMMMKEMYYNLSIRRMDAPNLQENLFLQHPTYKK